MGYIYQIGSVHVKRCLCFLQYYASEGFKTCLAIQSQDPTAEQLMGCKIGNSLTGCAANLSAIKLQTSKVKCFVQTIFSLCLLCKLCHIRLEHVLMFLNYFLDAA
jgi:hypothetical protein